jgi:menaquinone-9 beta-reductase
MRIAIVGAGPAGAMAAIRLARAGASVTLFDPSHPREKPCGGGLTGRALALVADVLNVAALPAVTVTSAVIEDPGADESGGQVDTAATVTLIDRGLSPASSLVVMSRAVFDQALLDAAAQCGVHVIAEKVIDVTRTAGGMTVVTPTRRHDADWLLGADGTNSLVRKRLARPFFRSELSIAAGYFVHGPRTSAIAIRSMTRQPGYLWSFPRPDHLAVGICAPASGSATAPDLLRQCRTWIESRGWDRGSRLDAYAWPIPSAGFSPRKQFHVSGPGWLLLGDAAGLVDPLTREGIYYALLSGVWAAEAIAGGRPEHAYASRLRDELYPELNRAARLSARFFSPTFAGLFVAALRDSAPIRAVFVDLVAGTQPYRGLQRRLLRTREWKLAGRALRMVVQ